MIETIVVTLIYACIVFMLVFLGAVAGAYTTEQFKKEQFKNRCYCDPKGVWK